METKNTFTETANEVLNNRVLTTNGAPLFKTSGSRILDCNFKVSGWRTADEADILTEFSLAYKENPKVALTWLFFLRDCRGGLGERRAFRIIFTWLSKREPDIAIKLINYIDEYGRYDDLIYLLGVLDCHSPVFTEIIIKIKEQLFSDIRNAKSGKPISLLAKWLPSNNASSPETRRLAKLIEPFVSDSPRDYRKLLSSLRKYLNVTEVNMSANEWENINYEKVPAKAALRYANAFLVHDEFRRREYLKSVVLGKAKANISSINPYEILRKAVEASREDDDLADFYNTIWDNLVETGFPDTDAFDGCLPVVDTSGSMGVIVSGSVSARDIAFSLGLYFSQKANGAFHNKMMTFSEVPGWIEVTDNMSLSEKYDIMRCGPWGMNTSIQAVFQVLLSLAKSENVKPEDMPKSILIVSDMQFDRCVSSAPNFHRRILNYDYGEMGVSFETTFEFFRKEFHDAGYQLPKLIFWSVTARPENGVPMKDQGDNGVVLISGYSQNAAKTAMSDKKEPLEALYDVLNSERYAPIRETLSTFII